MLSPGQELAGTIVTEAIERNVERIADEQSWLVKSVAKLLGDNNGTKSMLIIDDTHDCHSEFSNGEDGCNNPSHHESKDSDTD